MKTLTKHLVLLALCLFGTVINAQDTLQKSDRETQIEKLLVLKVTIQNEEKDKLKQEVETINKQLEKGEISAEKAEELKLEAAKKHALNIENKLAILDNQISLLERNEEMVVQESSNTPIALWLGKTEDSDQYDRGSFYVGYKKDYEHEPRKYDRRTSNDLVFAIGFNNAIIEGQSLSDSPYKLGGSGFVELGWAWKTRVFENSNAMRLKYGFSLQWNKLDIKDNKYFIEDDGGNVSLVDFPSNVKKSKFRTTNLVFPVHFEFGPSKKIEKENYFRYSTYHKFKFGIGGYGGFNIASLQKVKYTLDGDKKKDKFKHYNTNSFVYGLSAYAGFGNMGVYFKYDLSPIFKNQAIDQNNISLGLRFDLD